MAKNETNTGTKTLRRTIGAGLVGLAMVVTSGCGGCRNDAVPAGHEGYQVNKPYFIGSHSYVKTIKGPKSTGLTWRDFVDPVVDMRPSTYSENYQILTSDNLNVSFESHAIMKLKADSCKQVVEDFGGKDWFARFVQEPYRAAVRETVRSFKAYDVKDKSSEIAAAILEQLKTQYKDTPIVVESVSIGNIDYPDVVNRAVEKKLATEQELEQKQFEMDIAVKDAEITVTEAKGIAESQQIINETLTPNYLQHEAIQVQEKLASSPNTTIIYIPVGQSGIPIVHNSEADKVSEDKADQVSIDKAVKE